MVRRNPGKKGDNVSAPPELEQPRKKKKNKKDKKGLPNDPNLPVDRQKWREELLKTLK